ncbi:3'(2'),5'-bisphosphate nucleotidase CysQ family protein [Saccharospirillum impatiens]|uniref:3'(2'),5'-bisphosphate nucleotidase CysQ family protein n=1 Tax=Saccharospirillum impatiens TaxID=169438 RepID=UPI00040164D5|nr:3'(2'),5'-bisphosphate nucleotidase CysQ [Saccharospirillum impatiens]
MPAKPDLSEQQIDALFHLMKQAGGDILAVYHDRSRWQTDHKADDSPVTAADLAASRRLVAGLPAIVACPVLSEEALVPFAQRHDWQTYWLVDPMDGTREFLHQSDEFVINVALMHEDQPLFGMVLQPVTGIGWWGGVNVRPRQGAPGLSKAIAAASATDRVQVLGSRRSAWKGPWRDRLETAGYSVETRSVGSALKFMLLANGTAHCYPRLGPTSEWDTAAPQAILTAAGGGLVQWNGAPLAYGKESTLNPEFVAVSDLALLAVLCDP